MTHSLQRDMDLIRDLLLRIEGGEQAFTLLSPRTAEILGVPDEETLPQDEVDSLEYHFDLLEDAEFITLCKSSGGVYSVETITWKGHDFLDSVRDPAIWAATKKQAQAVGGWTVDTLVALAKGYAKKMLEDKTGIVLDI